MALVACWLAAQPAGDPGRWMNALVYVSVDGHGTGHVCALQQIGQTFGLLQPRSQGLG